MRPLPKWLHKRRRKELRNGIAGWLCALLPLALVNALGYLGLVDTTRTLLAGAGAIGGGPLLGGVVVGLLGGRPGRRKPGGATGALSAIAVAGVLYLASLLGLVFLASKLGVEPDLLAAHPIRVALAAVCLACVLAMVGLGVAVLVGRFAKIPAGGRARASHRSGARPGTVPGTKRTLASAAAPTTTRNRAPVAAGPRSAPRPTVRRPSSDRDPGHGPNRDARR